ncbi:MAG: hypothetical protein ACKOAU_08880 [Pirellula sp.]
MIQTLDQRETTSISSDIAVLDDWFEAALQSSSDARLPSAPPIRSSWGDEDDEPDEDDLPDEEAPEREDDEPDPFDDFDEEDFDDDFDDDFEEELDDEYQIEPADDGMLEGHPDAEDIDEELDEDGNPIEFPDDE